MALDIRKIQTNLQKLRSILKKASKLRSPKRIHNLRTRTRRVEAVFSTVGLVRGACEKRLLRQLQRVRKRAGKVRDMDVLTSHLLDVCVDGNTERECEVRLLEYIGAERYRKEKKLRRVVRRHKNDLRSELNRLGSQIESLDAERPGVGITTARTKAAATALELTSALAEPKTLNRANLHPYRLKVKQLRYLLKSAQGVTDHGFIDALGECKDAIGEWHDWEELLAIAGRVLDHRGTCKLIEQLRTTSQAKFVAALAITNSMRRCFVFHRGSRRRPWRSQRKMGSHAEVEAAASIARRRLPAHA
jgi:CHAD domain-containing protein